MTPYDVGLYRLVSVYSQGTSQSLEELTIINGLCTVNPSFVNIKANPLTNARGRILGIQLFFTSLDTNFSFGGVESKKSSLDLDLRARVRRRKSKSLVKEENRTWETRVKLNPT